MAFNLSDYETVESRLVKFWKDNPDGRIETELIEANATRFIIMARIFRTEADPKPWTTGHAFEVVSDRGVNATSALENAETSAIGRCLANAGYATHGKRPSREEMTKVARVENDKVTDNVEYASVIVDGKITVAPVDSWETFTATMPDTVQAPISDVVTNLKATLGAEEIPQCVHGNRQQKTGTSKQGKPYLGWVCTGNGTMGVKCEPIWYIYVSQTGTFRAPQTTE